MTLASGAIVVPGQRLAATSEARAGPGAYVRGDAVYASIAGVCLVTGGEVRVGRLGKTVGSAQVLRLGDVVLCSVLKLSTRQVIVDIVCVNDVVLQEAFPGTIRLEDVRDHDLDRLVMEDVFHPGQLVKAAVLSFGDTRSYFLSTAKPGLGVVRAVSTEQDQDIVMS